MGWCKRCLGCCAIWVLLWAVVLGFLGQAMKKSCPPKPEERLLQIPERCALAAQRALGDLTTAPKTSRERRRFDVTVYGATGFTGRLAAEYLTGRAAGYNLTWAIAGRSRSKLEALRRRLAAGGWWGGPFVEEAYLPTVLAADSGDMGALREMAKQSEVVVTYAGPYMKFGSPVVEACVREGTGYVDITGETIWIRRMAETWKELSAQTGAAMVFSAGYDSAPFDLLASMLAEAVREAGDEPTEVRSIPVRMVGYASLGTITSGINMGLQALLGNADPAMLCDPYLYLRPHGFDAACEVDTAVNPIGHAHHASNYELFGHHIGITIPHPLASPNSNMIRYTLHKLGFHNVSYSEEMAVEDAGMDEIPKMVSSGELKVADLLWPKEVPEALTRKGFSIVEGAARGLKGKIARLRLESLHGDPGYNWTAALGIEAALCLSDEACRRPGIHGGFHSVSTALGQNYARRMERAGILRLTWFS